jgi:hypothetical protein
MGPEMPSPFRKDDQTDQTNRMSRRNETKDPHALRQLAIEYKSTLLNWSKLIKFWTAQKCSILHFTKNR